MAVLGLNYTGFSSKKRGNPAQKLEINTTPVITKVAKANVAAGGRSVPALGVEFSLKTSFSPDIGEQSVDGVLLYSSEDADKVLKEWEKTKRLPADAQVEVVNYIFRTAAVKALQLADMTGFPPVITMPTVRAAEPKKKPGKRKARKK